LVEHLTQKQVEDYCRRQLRVAELLAVSDHLGECEPCRHRAQSAMSCDTALFALRAEVFDEEAGLSSPQAVREHLTPEQTAGYVDNMLSGDELQIVTDHLSACEPCVLAVEDLAAFKSRIEPSLEREYHPATATPAPAAEGWWHRTMASLPAFFRVSPQPAFGAVLAILLLALTGSLAWFALRDKEPKQETVASNPSVPQPTPLTQSTPSEQQPAPTPQPEPAPVVAQLNDGEKLLALNQEGKLSGADDLPPAYQKMLKEALATRRIERSAQLQGLSRPSSSLKGADNQGSGFSVIWPVGIVLLTDRPTLRWSQMEGATGYVVEIYDGGFNLVASSPQLANNSWLAPALSRGKVYSWQVKAVKDGQEFTSPRPPAPQAKFRILDQLKANELMKAKRAYPSSHLTLGLLYADAGLLDEAERELRLLQRTNPGSEIVRSLLSQIQALRRRNE
jgi:anti-sigma factor RsiW